MYLSLSKVFIYIIVFFGFFLNFNAYSSSQKILYSGKSISNYFSGIVSSKNNNNKLALKYFDNLEYLKNKHHQFNQEFVFTLVQENEFPELFIFLKRLEKKNSNFFNANLLLGINYLLEKNYKRSENYFNLIIADKKFTNFQKLIAQQMLNHVKVFKTREYNSTSAINSVPKNYKNFVLISDALMNCYLDDPGTEKSFLKISDPSQLNFSRYKFFYVNFLLSKNRKSEAIKILGENDNLFNSNILLNQTRMWLEQGNESKIKKIFNCKKPKHLVSEFFYLIANLFSSEKRYALSNFYVNISLYLNPKFSFNKMLLAENYFFLEDYKNSEKIYSGFDFKDSLYSWFAKKRLVWIKSKIENEESAINYLNKSFENLKDPTIENYLDLANFYKDFERYEDSIKYYTKVLNNINRDHPMYSKILHRRGMSYERIKMWEESEKDLIESLNISPNEPYVLNYLAYSWLERNTNLDKSIEMLENAFLQRKEDPYIIDSLGWGLYLTGRYEEAEKFLQKAVMLMPLDPIVNDHYGDILWKLNKNLQAIYFWNYVLNLENVEDEMKDKIKKKLILGVQNNS